MYCAKSQTNSNNCGVSVINDYIPAEILQRNLNWIEEVRARMIDANSLFIPANGYKVVKDA